MYAYPLFPQRRTRSLDGFWEFAFLGEDLPPLSQIGVAGIHYDEVMAVPGCFDAAPKYAGKRGVGAYRTRIEVVPHAQMRLILHGAGLAAKVFLNGKEIFTDLCPWSKVAVEFTSGAENAMTLEILTDNRIVGDPATPLFCPDYDFYGYGGIYRSVELETLPAGPHFERAAVEVLDFEGKVRITGTLHGGPVPVSAAFDGQQPQSVSVCWEKERFSFETVVPHAQLWTPEHPELHLLTLQAGEDEIVERFGLRTISCSGGKILLNGEVLRLFGFNRHDVHPQFGPAVPDELWIEDLQILKDLNCNFIRGCHYPQSQRFLDLCDQLGFLVWEESLGWGNREESLKNSEFRKLQVEQTSLMVRNSINHPAVICWAFMNESDDRGEPGASLLGELAATVRKIDRSRPVTNASVFVKDSRALAEYDVISFNVYPGWYEATNPGDPRPLDRIAKVLDEIIAKLDSEGRRNVPLILSEIGAGALYGWRDRVHGIWSEEYQADYLDEVITYFQNHPRLSGLAIWHFCDARTYAATRGVLGRPRAFNNKGVLDEYRRPKLACDRVKARFGQLRKK